MTTYRAVHYLIKIEDHPDLLSGNTVPWSKKYFGTCGYSGFARRNYSTAKWRVTCIKCKKKIASIAPQSRNDIEVNHVEA